MHSTKYYDGHRVSLSTTLRKTIKKRKYISEYPDPTYRTAQKGLTLLGVALLDEDKIFSINELHDYIKGAYIKFPEYINNMTKLTPKLPNSMENFME